jgi:hypothetical protein
LNKAEEVIAVAEEIRALNPQYAAVAVHKAGTHRVLYELETD